MNGYKSQKLMSFPFQVEREYNSFTLISNLRTSLMDLWIIL